MATLPTANPDDKGHATSRVFGHLADGRTVTEYTLSRESGIRARILDYGGIIRTLEAPDRSGKMADLVLGFDKLESYTARHPYFGAIIGRYAGGIAAGRLSVDGADVILAANNGANHLHGGVNGFDRALWAAEVRDAPTRLVLRHISPAGDEGYPGTLSIQVTYTLTNGALRVEYVATTDATTPVNLTQHTYFNLSGHASGDVLAHTLQIEADAILELDPESIPTGRFLPVAGTPFDFREARRIAEGIDAVHPQLELAKGYDHNWILKATDGRPNVVLTEAVSGRRLEIYTTQPGIQVYTANYLDGSVSGKGGPVYRKHAGIALETQHFPDSPNHPDFPSTLLRAGETYRSQTEFRFGLAE